MMNITPLLTRNKNRKVSCKAASALVHCVIRGGGHFTKSIAFFRPIIVPVFKNYTFLVIYGISRLYLAGVIAAKLSRHLPNMNGIQRI